MGYLNKIVHGFIQYDEQFFPKTMHLVYILIVSPERLNSGTQRG
jgi:hypothetical protein